MLVSVCSNFKSIKTESWGIERVAQPLTGLACLGMKARCDFP